MFTSNNKFYPSLKSESNPHPGPYQRKKKKIYRHETRKYIQRAPNSFLYKGKRAIKTILLYYYYIFFFLKVKFSITI